MRNIVKSKYFHLVKKRPLEKALYIVLIIINAFIGHETGDLPALITIIFLSVGFIIGHILAEPLWEYEKDEWPYRSYPSSIRKKLNKYPGIKIRIASWVIILLITLYFVLQYIAYLHLE